VLRLLYWLQVRQRVDIKIATLVHRSLSGNQPSYLADDCRLIADARERRLCSMENRTCVVTRTHITFGDGTLAAAVPDYGTVHHHISERFGLIVQLVPAVTKDIFVWIAGPWRSANYFNCAA